MNYLHKTPQRYDHVFQKNSGSREMVAATEGEWVRFGDVETELTDLRMKLGFRDAHIESLQNKWASRPLSSEDQAKRIEALEAALRGVLPKFWASDDADEAVYQNAKALLAQSETACVECGGSGLTMQPGMPDGEPEGLPCPKCKSKRFAPIGNGTICSNCTKTIGYHYQTAAGVLWCKVPTSDRSVEQGSKK